MSECLIEASGRLCISTYKSNTVEGYLNSTAGSDEIGGYFILRHDILPNVSSDFLLHGLLITSASCLLLVVAISKAFREQKPLKRSTKFTGADQNQRIEQHARVISICLHVRWSSQCFWFICLSQAQQPSYGFAYVGNR